MELGYIDSLAALVKGAKIRRSCWPLGDFVLYSRPASFVPRPPHVLIRCSGDHIGFVASADDIEATDWVVIDEQ